MPNALNESSEVLSEESELLEEPDFGESSNLDGNPEGSPYFVGVPEGSEDYLLYSETTGTEVYSQDFEQIHTYLEAQHSQQVLTVVLLAAIFGTLLIKFFFDRLKV